MATVYFKKGCHPPLSLDAKEYFVSAQSPESASAGDSGDLADGEPLSQENSSLGNVT